MTERFVEHDGLRFRCRVDGAADAPWMVFSNSMATDLTVWDAQVAAFGARFRILRYDQRGHGGTAVPGAPATMAQLGADAVALMLAAGTADAVFVGLSMGVPTGLQVIATAPGLVGRMVAADGQAATAPGGAEAWAQRIATAEAEGMAAVAETTVARWFAPRSLAEANPAIPVAREMVAATPLGGYVACARALQSYDLRPVLAGMVQPLLCIAGAADGAMPAGLRAIADQVPNGRYVEIADAGHLPCLERPAAFNAALAAFLE